MTTMTSPLQHPQFQATLEAYAARAHAALPLANGRIEKAVDLVRSGGVTANTFPPDPGPAIGISSSAVESRGKPRKTRDCTTSACVM